MLLFASLLALIALLAFRPSSPEPSYRGHHLSYWVVQLSSSSLRPGFPNPQYERATNAINHIGVAALPFLLTWIQDDTPPRNPSSLARLLYRTRLPVATWLADRVWGPRYPFALADVVPDAFGALGKKAMPAFNELCLLMNGTNNGPHIPLRAAGALSCFGTNALFPLLEVATNSQHQADVAALAAIGAMSGLDNAAQITVASAITNLVAATSNLTAQVIGIRVLGDLKAAPQISVPFLVSTLTSKTMQLRPDSAAALGDFGSEAISAVPALTNALTDSHGPIRFNAAHALHEIEPATFTNEPSQ